MTNYTAKFMCSDNDGNAGEQRDWFHIGGEDTCTDVGRCFEADGTETLIDDAGHPLTAGDVWTEGVRRAIHQAAR